jgi:hypothetical protein
MPRRDIAAGSHRLGRECSCRDQGSRQEGHFEHLFSPYGEGSQGSSASLCEVRGALRGEKQTFLHAHSRIREQHWSNRSRKTMLALKVSRYRHGCRAKPKGERARDTI